MATGLIQLWATWAQMISNLESWIMQLNFVSILMKPSKFSQHKIIPILKEVNPVQKISDVCRQYASRSLVDDALKDALPKKL